MHVILASTYSILGSFLRLSPRVDWTFVLMSQTRNRLLLVLYRLYQMPQITRTPLIANVLKRLALITLALPLFCGLMHAQASVNEALETAFLWVDAVNGSDSNPGTELLPLKTIGAAASIAVVNNTQGIGTQININPGTYRESINLLPQTNQTNLPITFQAATPGTVVVSGAISYTNWSLNTGNANLYTTAWANQWGFCPADTGGAPLEQPIVLRRELVFVNGAFLTEVLSLAQMVFPGTFFVDETNGILYVWPPAGTQMTAADVEVGNLSRLVTVSGWNGVVFRGLTFQNAASCHQDRAVSVEGTSTNILFDTDNFLWNGGDGLAILHPASSATVVNSVSNHNGAAGYIATKAKNILWQNVEGSYSNWRGAQGAYYTWNTGGAHIFGDHEETVSGFTSLYNQTFGIHWDTDIQTLSVTSLASIGNASGVLLESSEGPISISSSRFCVTQRTGTGEGGLVIRNTEMVSLTGNTLYDNGNSQITTSGTPGGVSIKNWETGATYSLNTQNLTLSGNIVEGVGGAQQDFKYGYVGLPQWTTFETTLVSNDNIWWDANSSNVFTVPVPKPGTAVSLAGWQTDTGQDTLSTFGMPPVSSSATCAVTPDGPDWQLLVDNGLLTADNTGTAVFNLTAVSIGGFSGTAAFALDGILAIPGATAQFTPSTIGIPGTSTLTFLAAPQTPGGVYTFTVLANTGNTTRTITLNVTVPNAALTVSSPALTFGAQQVGTTSPGQVVTLTNNGTTAVSISTLSVSSGFSQTNTCPASLAGNASCTVTIAFSPLSLGAATGTLVITFPNLRPEGVVLAGTAMGMSTTAVTSSGTVNYGQPVTFTAIVTGSPAGVTPTGPVTFLDTGVTLGIATLNSGGAAAFNANALAAGTHTITASYSGDSNFLGSTSSGLGQTVNQAASTIGLTPSAAIAMYGTPLMFTATVTPSTATGSVQFLDGTAVLGSVTLAGGTAVYATPMLAPGSHQIAAIYSGDSNDAGSNSAALTVTVTQIVTVTTLSAANNPVQADPVSGAAPVTLTASVNPASAGGVVQFLDGSANLGAAVPLVNGIAATTVTLNTGVHNLSGMYGGDALDLAGSGSLSETIYNTAAGSNVAVSPQDLASMQPVPADTITFATVSQLGITNIATIAMTDPSFPGPLPARYQTGQPANFFNLTTSASFTGSIAVCISYSSVTYSQPSTLTLLHYDTTPTPPAWAATSGQTNTQSSSTICGNSQALGSFIIVEDTATALSVASSANPSAFGQSVTLTATLTPAAASGPVTFNDGLNSLGTVAIANGAASLTTSQLTAGAHAIQASYTDPSNFFGNSSGQLTQTVNQGTSTASVISSTGAAVYGQPVTFTATVAGVPAGSAPTGSVTFLDGGNTLATVPLSAGTASFSAAMLSAGTHGITVTYGGDANFFGSTSAQFSQIVAQAASSDTLTASAAMAMYGVPVTFSANISPSSATGSVQFFDGATVLATVTVTAGTATFSTAGLLPGLHSITSSFTGSTNYAGSNSTAVVVSVTPIVTVTTFASSGNPLQADAISGTAAVTLTASVSPVSAGGSVQFMDGAANLGQSVQLTGGSVTITVPLNVGLHNLTAIYGGDALDSPSSGSIVETIYNTGVGANVVVSPQDATSLQPVAADGITFSAVTQLGITNIATVGVSDPSFPGPLASNYQTGQPANFFNLTTTAATSGPITVCLGYAGVTYSQPSALTLLHYDTTLTPAAWTNTTGQSNTPSNTTICGNTQTLGSFIVVENDTTSLTLSSSANPAISGQGITFIAVITPSTASGSVTFTDGQSNLGTIAVANGAASLTTSQLSAGVHSIQAAYGDPANFFANSSGQLTQTISQGASTTTVASSASPVVYGQPVTFFANVTGPSGSGDTPTGSVTFLDGGVALGSAALVAGKASLTTSLLNAGSHAIKVSYGGDANFLSGSSAVLTQTIGQASSAVGVTSSLPSAVFGVPLTFTATVTPAIASGTVQFSEGTAALGSASITGGIAIYTTAALLPGLHQITASYLGSANYTGISSAAITVNVTQTVTATMLNSSGTPVQADPIIGTASVTLTASVNPPTATGAVQFSDGSAPLGSAVQLSNGIAAATVTLNAGIHTLSAVYSGDVLDLPSSGSFSETIYNTPAGANIAVAPQDVKTLLPVAGDTLTFAAVSQPGITSIATLPVSDPSFPAPLPVNYQTGQPANFVNLTTTAANTGSITVCLSYATMTYPQPSALTLLHYDPTLTPPAWSAATSQINTQATGTVCGNAQTLGSFVIVENDASSLALTSSANPSVAGQSVVFTAVITPPSATGVVSFSYGGVSLGSAVVTNGTAGVMTSQLNAGAQTITATYTDPTGFFVTSSAQLTQNIGQGSSTTVMTSSATTLVFGQSVTFTATVAAPAGGLPTGSITFLDGGTALGAATLAAGKASVTIATLNVGHHSITALYGGDINFQGSTSTAIAENVAKASAAVTLAASLNPSVYGQTVTFTATVTAVAPGAGAPTGSVTFKDGTTTLATVSLSGGVTTFATAALSVGTHSISAAYTGDANFNKASSTVFTQIVNKPSATVMVSSSQSPSVYGQSITLTAIAAAMAPASGTPTGSVTFRDGTVSLGKVTLGSGQATLLTATLAVGAHSISVVYSGDSNFGGTTSPVITQTVNLSSSAGGVSSSQNPAKFGQPVTFTATVIAVAPGTGTPTGTVTFMDGTSTLGVGSLSNGKASLKSSTLASGSHSIVIVYGGDTHFAASTSPILSQTVK